MIQRCFLCLTALACFASVAPLASAANFSKLPISMEVSSMTTSEDGKLVILSHRASSKLSIWHVESEKVIHSVACESPGAVLSRGDRTYVLNLGQGTIAVFGHSNWEMIDQIEAPTVGKATLTAPQGKSFNGTMIMSEEADRYETKLYAIDTKNDRFKELGKAGGSGLTSSYNGKMCVEQASVNLSPSATIQVKGSFEQYLTNRMHEPIRGEHQNTPLLFQVRNSEFWFGGNRIYRGLPPKPLGEALGRIVVPDRTRDLAYALTPQSLTCKSLIGSMSEVGKTKVNFPKSFQRMKSKDDSRKRWGEVDRQHVAVSHGDSLYVFIYSESGDVYRSRLNAFAAPGDANFAQSNSVAMTESDSSAPVAAANENSLLPNQVLLGKELKFKTLPGDVTGEFSIVQGPEGAVVDNNGLVTWTPTNRQLGEQRIKIRAKLGEKVQFLRFNTFVVTRMGEAPVPVVSAAPGVDTVPSEFAKLPIAMQTSAMVITENGKHLILSHTVSDKLTVWNIQDKAIEESIVCDSPGKMISRGNNTYIGGAGGKIFVLNHSTWKIGKKTAEVGVSQINALTAPQGRFFKGIVLATSHIDRNHGQFTFVDVARNRAKVWHKPYDNSVTTCSYNGKYVITQSGHGGYIDVHENFNELASGRKTASPGRNGERCPLIRQVRNNEFWYGHKWVFRGMPPKRTGDEQVQIVVGDRNHDVFYRIDEQRIVAFSMKGSFQEIGSAKLQFPRDFERMHEDLRKSHHNSNAGGYDRDHIAITVDNKLHLFLIGDKGDVYYRPLNAFVRTSRFTPTKGYSKPKTPAAPAIRTWKDTTGTFSITAKLVEIQDGKVVLQRANGEKVTVPLERLGESDRRYISSQQK